ncbi:hypothetical protein ES703_95430 [subsurface metagenome]
MFVFCTIYLIVFGTLAGLAGHGAAVFSTSEFITMIIVSGGITITVAIIAAAAAGIGILGSGSGEAGRYVWKGALFALLATWVGYFVYKIADMLPSETPVGISTLLLGPPIVGIIWGVFKVWQGARD